MPRMFARHSPGTPALILYRKGDSWGFCNRKKELVIPAVYDQVGDFVDGLASTSSNGKWGFIDTKGAVVIPAVYDLVFGFADGLLRVQFNGKWGYMDMQGVQYWED